MTYDEKPKAKFCKYCGTEYSKEDTTCPNCKKIVRFRINLSSAFFVVGFLLVLSMSVNAYLYSEINTMKTKASDDYQEIKALSNMMRQSIGTRYLQRYNFTRECVAVITENGEKYHAPDCQYLANSRDVIICSVAGARRSGFEACTVCHWD